MGRQSGSILAFAFEIPISLRDTIRAPTVVLNPCSDYQFSLVDAVLVISRWTPREEGLRRDTCIGNTQIMMERALQSPIALFAYFLLRSASLYTLLQCPGTLPISVGRLISVKGQYWLPVDQLGVCLARQRCCVVATAVTQEVPGASRGSGSLGGHGPLCLPFACPCEVLSLLSTCS